MSSPVADAGPHFSLNYFEPAADLRSLVSSYYLFSADLPRVVDVMRADLAQLRFMIAGHGHYRFGDGAPMRTPAVSLIGPTTASTSFDVEGPLIVFGVGILPAGWAALVRDDASRYANLVEDATDIFGALLGDALDAMRTTPAPDLLVSIADAVMRALAARAQDPPLWFTDIADRWLTGAASPDVGALIAEAGLSARQIERLARRIYGAPPKLLSRKYRALRAASAIAADQLPWSEVVGEAYYDQSHFIRDFKRFTGLTPRQFQLAPPPVTRLMLQRRALAGRLPEISVVS